MKSFPGALLCMGLILAALSASADEATKHEKIMHLLTLQQLPEVFEEARSDAEAQAEDIHDQTLAQLRQSLPGPALEAYFDRVEPLLETYVEECRPDWTVDEVVERYARLFGAEVLESDVDLLIASLETPEGQRVVEADRLATRVLMKELSQRQQKKVQLATARFGASIQELIEEMVAASSAGGN